MAWHGDQTTGVFVAAFMGWKNWERLIDGQRKESPARFGTGQKNETQGLGSGFGDYSTCYWYVCRFLQMFLTTPPPLQQCH
jgi:hypothetical protein